MTRERMAGIDLRQLRAFVALVEHGTTTGAARTIGVAQSTVSESLAALERALGTSVVLRRRGAPGVVLTPAGQTLLPHARAVLAAVDAARAAVIAESREAVARVEIITNESVSTYILPRALAPLRERWPNTRFAVSIGTCSAVRAGIRDGEYDVGVLLEQAGGAPPDLPNATRVVLHADVSLVVFAAPTHPLTTPPSTAPGRALSRDTLADFPMFVSDAAGDFHTILSDFLRGGGSPGPRLQPAGSVEGVKQGVTSDTRALGILPAYAVQAELAAGRVAVIRLRPPPPRMTLEGLMSAKRPRHPAVPALLDAVRRKASAQLPQ